MWRQFNDQLKKGPKGLKGHPRQEIYVVVTLALNNVFCFIYLFIYGNISYKDNKQHG